jgi:COMPASS component SWD3
LWNIRTGTHTTLVDEDRQSGRGLVAFSSNGSTLASGCWCISDITLWDAATGKKTFTLEAGIETIRSLLFMPDGKTLLSLNGYRGEIKVWDVATGKNTATLTLVVDGKAQPVGPAAFSADGKTLATSAWRDGIKLWDLKTANEADK